MSQSPIEHIVVLVTCPPERAPELARALVEARLAACVNVLPTVRSIYSWQGTICDDGEALLVIKTSASLFDPLRAKVVELHPYEVPEVIALPIRSGHAPYLRWLDDCTRA
jgi:periplasmic divalent cation tolerance protein